MEISFLRNIDLVKPNFTNSGCSGTFSEILILSTAVLSKSGAFEKKFMQLKIRVSPLFMRFQKNSHLECFFNQLSNFENSENIENDPDDEKKSSNTQGCPF